MDYEPLRHGRRISEIASGEGEAWLSTDGGTTWVAMKGDALGAALSGGTSKTILTAKIDIATAATHEIIAATAAQKIYLCSIVFTLSAENDITLKDDTTAFTGAMPFGGTGEPKGWSENYWPAPIPFTTNKPFQITLGSAEQVSGFCTYYKE